MIATVKKTEGIGSGVLKKTIHKGSESIVFDVLQVTQYKYPIKSSIREIVTNALDSINERNDSLAIIEGKIDITEKYIEKQGEEFAESRFDAEYYDPKWLSTNKMVTIEYVEYDTELRDKIRFIDEGVGLGGKRLVGFFAIGFSSKRLSTSQSGAFGLGAKALLATDIDYYTMITRYNGRKYSFNIFKDHTISTTPKFNSLGELNGIEELNEDFVVYYENTEEKNGVIIEAEVKRHKKQEYITAIKNQLGFIENIELTIIDKLYGLDNKKDIKTNVVFKKDNILVGDFDYYSVPQIVLKPGPDSNVMISYGKLSFPDLEMKDYSGNVVFVMDINDVDVTPSRESIRYTGKTRDAVKNMFIKAQNVIFNTIEEKLVDIEVLSEYLYKFDQFKNPHSIDGMAELFKVINTEELTSKFFGFKLNKYTYTLSSRLGSRLIFTTTNIDSNNKEIYKIDYSSNNIMEKYIRRLYSGSPDFGSTILFISNVKKQNFGLYAKKKGFVSGSHAYVIFMHVEEFEKYAPFAKNPEAEMKKIQNSGIFIKKADSASEMGAEERIAQNEAAEKMMYLNVLYAKNNGLRTVFLDDIEPGELSASEEDKETEINTRHLNWGARQRAMGKWGIRKFSHSNYSNTIYKDLEDVQREIRNGTIIYELNDHIVLSILSRTAYSYTTIAEIWGLNKEQYKEACGMPGATPLIGALYSIEFGDFRFTTFGKSILKEGVQNAIKDKLRGQDNEYDYSYNVDNILKSVLENVANLGITSRDYNNEVNESVRIIKDSKFEEYRETERAKRIDYKYNKEQLINNK